MGSRPAVENELAIGSYSSKKLEFEVALLFLNKRTLFLLAPWACVKGIANEDGTLMFGADARVGPGPMTV